MGTRMVWGGLLVLMLVLASSTGAHGQATLITGLGGPAGFGMNALPPGDDDVSAPVSLAPALPDGIRFYAATYTTMLVATNGNINLGGPSPAAHDTTAIPFAGPAFIAACYGDVDIRPALTGGRNSVYWSVAADRLVVTYYEVGSYAMHVDRLNSFQIILTDAPGTTGDFDVEFRYARCEWTTADASGAVIPQAGFNAGDGILGYRLPGSRTPAVLDLCTTSNVGMPGVWRYRFRDGQVDGLCGNGTVEPGEACDDGNVLGGDACTRTCELPPPLGLPCSADADCHSGFCTDGVCCGSRCDAQCEQCNATGALGTCRPRVGAPVGARAACIGTGPCLGACNGVDRSACTYPGSSVSCEDGAFCSAGDTCDGAGACTAGPPNTCDDTDACTADACVESTDVCTNTYGGGCSIGGACMAPGAIDPTNPCRACQPAISRVAFTLRDVGSACDDGAYCTVGEQCDGTGTCTGGAANACDDGLDCTDDTCSETLDSCSSVVADGCLIEGSCVATGGLAPVACSWCDPDVDAMRFVEMPGCVADAGVDAAAPLDAPVAEDAASPPDAGRLDASIEIDAGGSLEPAPGCACRASRSGRPASPLLGAVAIALLLGRRRRPS